METTSRQPVRGGGPQHYTHCFNVEISGNGNAEPEGITFPGGYKQTELGEAFALRNKNKWDTYVVPGPQLYQGKHESPTGAARVVAPLERGEFPEPFQSKYQTLKDDEDAWAHRANDFFNGILPPDASYGKGMGKDVSKMSSFQAEHNKEAQGLNARVAELTTEAKRLGYA